MEALFAQLAGQTQRSLDHLKTRLDAVELANARYFPTPYSSLTILGCSEQARDLSRGGAPYNASGVQAVGVADVANSLAVIEQLVFERRLCSLSQMAEACAANFEGFELLRAHALKVPKFGNDHAGTDRWAQRVTVLFDQLVSRYRNSRGGQWLPGFYSMTCHQAFGAHTAALPSGRLAGKPLADGLAPVDGSDLMGPTASLNSAAKLENERFANGINLNLKFDHDTVTGEGGRALLEALLKGYFAQGGMQMQINVLDPQVLLEAMADPQSHPNLLVRISGYSAYFADLTPEMQREIIDRVSQKVHRG
jgi:formate C-acetyltransferase